MYRKTRKEKIERRMAIGVKALPFSFVVHFLGVVGAILVLIWNISFRGGLAWESTNKGLIFNVRINLLCFFVFDHLFASVSG